MSMFPMTPLQSWAFLILVLAGVACLVLLIMRLDEAIDRRWQEKDLDPADAAAHRDDDQLAEIPMWLLDFDVEDPTPASFSARAGSP